MIIDEAYANGTLTKSQYNLAYYTVIQKAVATFDPQRQPDFGKLANEALAQVKGEPPATAA